MPSISRLRRATILCVLISLAVPAGAQALYKAIWGPPYRNGVNQFPIYKQLGVSIDEADLFWYQVAPRRPKNPTNPKDPAYHWSQTVDQTVWLAAAFHIRVLIQIIGAPRWANGGQQWNWAPRNPSDYANFAVAAARRYPSVHLWMVWGEANRRGTFMPEAHVSVGSKLTTKQQFAPHLYAQMVDATYGSLKAISKSNTIIGGSTFTTGDIDTQQWIENLRLPNGRPPRMDMYAHNPFGYTEPDFSAAPSSGGQIMFSDLPRMATWIDRYLRRGMPIFISEYTIPTSPNKEFPFWVDPSVAAQWLTAAFNLARGWHRIYALGWVNVYDRPPLSSGGLIESNGDPKPLFYAYEHG